MAIERTSFEKETDDLLKFIIHNRFFKYWADPEVRYKEDSLWRNCNLELYITTACNQKCEYCYLHKYEDKLYPLEMRDRKKIIENLKILLQYLIDNNYYLPRFDLFSGEIWHTPFGLEVLDTIIEYNKKQKVVDFILIPSNCSFLLKDEDMYNMQVRIDALASLGIRLAISCSVDGKVVDNMGREFRDKSQEELRDDHFYEKMFGFCKENDYLFHPMVSAHNVGYWKENLDWYLKKIDEYDVDINMNPIMMLEVRNDEWDEESIKKLLDYYDYQIDIDLKRYSNDIKGLARTLLGDGPGNGYKNIDLCLADKQIGCTASSFLTVRLGDLTMAPCHRTSYEELNYGKFVVEDGKIVDIIGSNPQMAIRTLCVNNLIGHHGCDTCPYSTVCIRGCFGAQYEYGKDPFMPIPSVCAMLKSKYYHLFKRYDEIGVIDEWRKIKEGDHFYETAQKLLKCYDESKKVSFMEGLVTI